MPPPINFEIHCGDVEGQVLPDEDKDLFVQVLNRGVTFHWHRMRARHGVFSYALKEVWRDIERLGTFAN